jgi:ATP-dependent RNA helicase HelY
VTPTPRSGPALTIDEFRRAAGYEFALDPFQLDAIDALRRGESVLVAAPTGSGKTVVAEYAVEAALAGQGRAFYTTPIKALSNQKYRDLARRHGRDAVGLLTGDNAVNADAPVVVMTTEVLRNMIYVRSPALDELHFVVLDEVHYLQDAYRGPVWEEVIIHLDPRVRLVCLSATVSNADDLADWITSVRGPTATVVETRRPVDLDNLYLIGDRTSDHLHLIPTLVDGRPNPEGPRFDADLRRPGRGRPRRRWVTPSRLDTVDLLAERDLLPVIYFIFSRAGCDDAVRATRDAGVRLTTPDERERITQIVDARTRSLSAGDLDVLRFDEFSSCLTAGLAAHHAGMVPPFKEAVEQCFTEGLVKVVYATETLALGINMPARTVVIEKLTKFTGETHEFLQPSQYTQITGRAGRRGIDDHGYAVVSWSPFVTFDRIAALASSRSFELRSAFRPTYNMAANLVHRYEADEAHRLLSSSFAQYQADREVVRLERRAVKLREGLEALRRDATCELGDVGEYRRLVDRAGARRPPRGLVEQALARLQPGDIIDLPDHGGAAVVLSVGQRKRGASRLRAVTADGHLRNLGAPDFDTPPPATGRLDLPRSFAPDHRGSQRELAARLRRHGGRRRRTTTTDGDAQHDEATPPSATAAHDHPVHACPDRDRHLAASRRLERAERELADIDRRIRSRTESLVRQFDQILQILEGWSFLDGWALGERGHTLVHIFHEADLLVAEAIHEGLFADLDAASLAALVSCLTYEHRSPAPAPTPWFPSREVRVRYERLAELATELREAEEAARLPLTPEPDPTFLPLAYAWAAGDDLDQVLDEDEELTGGDFVRNAKQLIDLLRQIGDAAGDRPTARIARGAADALLRDVVAASSVLGEVD